MNKKVESVKLFYFLKPKNFNKKQLAAFSLYFNGVSEYLTMCIKSVLDCLQRKFNVSFIQPE